MTALSKREAVVILLRTRDDHAQRIKGNRVYRAAPKGAAPVRPPILPRLLGPRLELAVRQVQVEGLAALG
jgi:hypothetical protein